MFGFFKSWDEKCLAAAKNLYRIDDEELEKWCSAFSSQISEVVPENWTVS